MFVTSDFYDLINDDVMNLFWLLYNRIMQVNLHFHVTAQFEEGEEIESMELAWQITSNQTVDHIIFDEMKQLN